MFGHIPEGYYKEQEEKRQKRRRDWLRDQFAMAALPAMIARRHPTDRWEEVVAGSYALADMMLAAREEKK